MPDRSDRHGADGGASGEQNSRVPKAVSRPQQGEIVRYGFDRNAVWRLLPEGDFMRHGDHIALLGVERERADLLEAQLLGTAAACESLEGRAETAEKERDALREALEEILDESVVGGWLFAIAFNALWDSRSKLSGGDGGASGERNSQAPKAVPDVEPLLEAVRTLLPFAAQFSHEHEEAAAALQPFEDREGT